MSGRKSGRTPKPKVDEDFVYDMRKTRQPDSKNKRKSKTKQDKQVKLIEEIED